jgi:hypothetical protein
VSVFIGSVKGPHHNSPADLAEVWCSPNQVELNLFIAVVQGDKKSGLPRNLDPIAARNLAALLVRASEEAERMAACREREAEQARTPMKGEPGWTSEKK